LNVKPKILLFTALVILLAGTCISGAYAGTTDAGQTNVTSNSQALGMIALGAGIAIAIAGFGAAFALGMATSAIAAAGAERPEIIGRFFIYIVFIEAIAIYALIVAIFIITMLPAYL